VERLDQGLDSRYRSVESQMGVMEIMGAKGNDCGGRSSVPLLRFGR
jgi:hypothetical protein